MFTCFQFLEFNIQSEKKQFFNLFMFTSNTDTLILFTICVSECNSAFILKITFITVKI